jgi:hypothetical protein
MERSAMRNLSLTSRLLDAIVFISAKGLITGMAGLPFPAPKEWGSYPDAHC